MKAVVEWISLLMLAVGLGLGAAAAQAEFDIPQSTMQIGMAVVVAAALVVSGWFAWRYWREVAKDDDWE